MSSELISSRIFILDLDTSAGTYVKEFVHGDLGTIHHLFAYTLLRVAFVTFQRIMNSLDESFPAFVSAGRTYPNVGSLLGLPVDILQLDVLSIEYAA